MSNHESAAAAASALHVVSPIGDEAAAISPRPVLVSAVRRCRQPVPARVTVADGQPVRVTTERRGFVGGSVVRAAGPWRSSGNWWAAGAGKAGGAGEAGREQHRPIPPVPPVLPSWNRDEWDVALNDGAVYRIFQDRDTEAWFVDGIVD